MRSSGTSVLRLLLLPIAVFVTAFFALSTPVHAAQTVPYKINFQGRLTNASGTVLSGTYDMQFKLYTALTGGTLVWSETRTAANANAVTVTNGLFSVLIGEGTAVAGSSATLQAGIIANTNLYMEVMVGTETLSPRSQFGSSAYAINADMLDGQDSSAFAPATGSTVYAPITGSTNYAPISGSTNYAPISGSANYIQNQTASAQSAGFNISGNGTIGGTGTVTGAFTNNGAATFYNSTNSAAAFTIQTSTAAKLFVADTTNSRIYVGNPSGDANTVVLVLDNSTATEAASVNGAMYYNSTNNKFRCYEGSAWKSCIPISNASTADQSVSAASTAYLTGSMITVPTGGLRVGTTFTWRITMSKTAAGTAANTLAVYVGTNGTTSDTSRLSFSTGTGTNVVDTAVVTIAATVRAVSSSATWAGNMQLTHNLAATGFSTLPTLASNVTSGTFNDTTSGLKVGVVLTTAASTVITVQQVQATTTNL